MRKSIYIPESRTDIARHFRKSQSAELVRIFDERAALLETVEVPCFKAFSIEIERLSNSVDATKTLAFAHLCECIYPSEKKLIQMLRGLTIAQQIKLKNEAGK